LTICKVREKMEVCECPLQSSTSHLMDYQTAIFLPDRSFDSDFVSFSGRI
jgi:hypothetical protein